MTSNISSMNAHSNWMAYNSNNIANTNTKDFNSSRSVLNNESASNVSVNPSQNSSGTDLAKELSDQIAIEKGFSANIPAIKAENEMMGTLFDMKA